MENIFKSPREYHIIAFGFIEFLFNANAYWHLDNFLAESKPIKDWRLSPNLCYFYPAKCCYKNVKLKGEPEKPGHPKVEMAFGQEIFVLLGCSFHSL